MPVSLDVALSAQIALEKRMTSIAHNVANSSTPGFRSDAISFEAMVSQNTMEPTTFTSAGDTYISRTSGGMVMTENPLDVAVRGEGWLAFQGNGGETVYTRDGRMKMLATGELTTLNGNPVLDAGGAPLVLNPNAAAPKISHDGMISQDNQPVGAIGLFLIPETANLTRVEGSGVISDRAAEPVIEFTTNGVAQGFIEQSNVNAVMEMSHLITVSRAFESLAAAIENNESTLQSAIRTLGETS